MGIDQFLEELQTNVRWVDLLDVGMIALVVYLFMVWFKQQAARTALLAFALVTLMYAGATRLDMYLTATLFRTGITLLLVAMLLVFQEDVRRIFERIASSRMFHRVGRSASPGLIEQLVQAVDELAREQTGALIVVKGREAIDRHIRGGVLIDGVASVPLLCSIFNPTSPGHDGAVVIDGERVRQLGVHLPLSNNVAAVDGGGTRHTAALGLSERCDALVVVVSEERGSISIAEGGRLVPTASVSKLKERLESFEQQKFGPSPPFRLRRVITNDLGIKFFSVCLATLLWLMFAYRTETIQRTYVVPIEYRNIPATWRLDEDRPTEARVTLSASERVFNSIDPSSLAVSLDLSRVRPGTQEFAITDEHLRSPAGVVVNRIEPRLVQLTVEPMRTVELPVRAQLEGRLRQNLVLRSVQVQPDRMHVQLSESQVGKVRFLRTVPINLETIREPSVLQVNLEMPEDARLPDNGRSTVTVSLNVTEKSSADESPSPADETTTDDPTDITDEADSADEVEERSEQHDVDDESESAAEDDRPQAD